jgi:phosphorylase kinase alpha/beta subunit
VLDIFKRFHPRIMRASIIKPDVRHQTGQFMPARVHPTTLDTITDAWGHHQLDVYGLFMYKMGDLIKKGYGFRFQLEDFTLISHIRNYIFNMGFEADYGMWEEGPEEHASSFGAVLGGLMMWFDQGFYDYKYRHKIEICHYVPVSERMIADGIKSLARVLPRESESRPYDMSQLSLIWPYNIVDFQTKKILLHNIETHLVGRRGVRRYPGDVYCGKGLVPGEHETAEWPLGLAWLAICYAKLAEHGRDLDPGHKVVQFDWTQRRNYFQKAVHYFQLLEQGMTPDGCVPEMYLGDRTGHNTPLAWAQSFHIISGQMLTNLAAAHPKEFKLPPEVRQRREPVVPVLAGA